MKISQPGTNRCPQDVTLTTRIRTNRPGRVKFRLEEGNGRTTPTFTADASRRPNGRFVAVHEHKVRFRKSRAKKYRVLVNGFPGASRWRNVSVKCNSAPPPAPFKVTSMALVADAGNGNRCPRDGVLKGWFITNKPGPVRFHLAWGNGRQSKSIAIKSVRESDGRFVARFRRPIRFPSPVNWRMRSELEGQRLASKWIPVQVRCDGHQPQRQWQTWQEQLLRKLEQGTIKSQR